MQYRLLGRTGLWVSEICIGTLHLGWRLDEAESFKHLTAAYEAGVNFIDTADVYSGWVPGHSGGEAETVIGKWLKSGVARRDDIIINTKVRAPMGKTLNDKGLSRHHVLAAAEGSLRRLGVDHIDLYMPHWPDDASALEETIAAMDLLVRRGDVHYIGLSAFPAWKAMQALWIADAQKLARISCVEMHYNLVQREELERELEPVAVNYGLGLLAYSPVAEGFLTGKFTRGETLPTSGKMVTSRYNMQGIFSDERSWDVLDLLKKYSVEHGASITQMALAWILNRPTITSVIIGARTPEQLQDNIGASGLRLSEEEMSQLNLLSSWRKRRHDEGQLDHDYKGP